MKICYFNGGRGLSSVRLREPFFQLLQQRGHDCVELSSRPSREEQFPLIGLRRSQQIQGLIRRWHILRVYDGRFDAVVLETGIFQNQDYSFERDLRRASGRLVYEIHDAVFLRYPEKTEAIAKMADRVIAANQQIADWASQYNQCVSVVPTCVNAQQYTAKEYRSASSSPPVVGWIGSSRNVNMLSVCAAALKQVALNRKFELRIISSDENAVQAIDLDGVDVRHVDIDRCDTVAELQQLDVGIMPLPDDDPSTQYKGNTTMIQYMAVGIPAIGSAIGFNRELVEHGKNSMLACNHDQWVGSLNALLDSAPLRQKLGQAARTTILQNYTVESRVGDYERAILGAKYQAEKRGWNYQ